MWLKKSFSSDAFLSAPKCLLFILLSQLDKILGLCTKELLQTPSELGDIVAQSQQGRILTKIPMKFHWIETMEFHEKPSVVDSETLYLRAQLELEGVLWCKVRIFYLTKMVG